MTGPAGELVGRAGELARIGAVVRGARDGTGGALLVRGEPGIGKTALLRAAADAAAGCQVLQVTGYDAEHAFSYAALDRLLRPLRGLLDELPAHHCGALRRVLDQEDRPQPEPYLVGLATLELLARAGRGSAVLCLVDDAHLLDHESLTVLTFVARRLVAEPVAVVLAARAGEAAVAAAGAGITTLDVPGLGPGAATALLRASLRAPVDPLIATRVAAATGGNPLALIDLAEDLTARAVTRAGLDDGPVPIGRHLEARYAGLVAGLPAPARLWLLVAAAASAEDLPLVDAACRAMGLPDGAAVPAEDAGLVDLAPALRFRHPLVRAAAYAGATGRQRRSAHAALSAAAEEAGRAEPAAWHGAKAVLGTDALAADRLERVAALAAGRGGHLSRARVLARAAELTPAGPARADRQIAAANAAVLAGAAHLATELLDQVDDAVLGPVARGRVLANRAKAGVFVGAHDVVVRATADLLRAAELFRGHDEEREERALLLAFDYALSAEGLSRGATLRELGERLRAGAAGRDGPAGAVLAALGALVLDPFAQAVPALRRGLDGIRGVTGPEAVRYHLAGVALSTALWDVAARREAVARAARTARDAGALRDLDAVLWTGSVAELTGGTPRRSRELIEQVRELRQAIGYPAEHVGNAALLAWSGAPRDRVEAVAREAASAGFGAVTSSATTALAVRDVARGRYREAFAVLHAALADPFLHVTPVLLPDYVEAAVRSGHRAEAVRAADELAARAAASGSGWARGLALRCQALVAEGARAGGLYVASVTLLGEAGTEVDGARSRLLHGEWLRRTRRRAEAREELQRAAAGFRATEAPAFLERAAAELAALGVHDEGAGAEGTGAAVGAALTPREDAVARMAARGDTNAEIAAALFISTHTVDYHLRKVFAKLTITSRRQLRELVAG